MICNICGGNFDIKSSNICSSCGTMHTVQQTQHNMPAYPYSYSYPYQSSPPNSKSKVLAGVLAILVPYGVYSFYLGHIAKGVVQLLMWLVFMPLFVIGLLMIPVIPVLGGILLFLSIAIYFFVWVWDLVDGIRILSGFVKVDAKGNPLV